ncbi:protein-L-isoaspartate O-methyltransferase domain-containing protein 1-like [Copidosoma floridanum]|uniref:protein-L-isoaspartate O-methyltransferase domain-containing protein 1-like n=1 Tax=Copidosoma floridanum TaxID=29053 RepID=UPI0006C96B89|nr:protein-L-isoaspartate O-methyltransferase domain-containing protein 1-like [Copidosoma floridanum]
MGNAFSNGQDNDELVDNLVEGGYIRTKKVQQVFRAIDRGDYFLSSHRDDAYKDFAWKHGNIHLSAPCIYCEVMEELSLQPGLSFLNLGSGTGYFSTMAGLLLTQNGINHGIELHEDCIKYAYDRLEEFKQKSLAMDEFDFCEPIFIQGNCLNVTHPRRYDRVYCGATCPESHEAMIKEFVKVGGILVMPYNDFLVKTKRIDENTWEQVSLLPVSFATLVVPTTNEVACQLPDCDPLSLQELCRGKIRRRLRQNVWREHADLETSKPIALERRPSPPNHALRQFIIPITEESDDDMPSDEDEESRVHRTQLLLNINGPPGENFRTTLQLMRAVIQPNRRNTAARNTSAVESNERPESEERPRSPVDADERKTDQPTDSSTQNQDVIDWRENEESPSTENTSTNFSSEHERQDSESSSDLACDKSHSESQNTDNIDKKENKPPANDLLAYSNMSESDSEPENESEADTGRRSLLIEKHKKASHKETSDSGIVEDACATGNDDGSISSDSDYANGTPVKHKRSSSSGNSSCSAVSSGSNNNSSRSDNNSNSSEPRRKRRPSRLGLRDTESPNRTGHYVDTNAFFSYMKMKIHLLPLPYALKMYINYNRTL